MRQIIKSVTTRKKTQQKRSRATKKIQRNIKRTQKMDFTNFNLNNQPTTVDEIEAVIQAEMEGKPKIDREELDRINRCLEKKRLNQDEGSKAKDPISNLSFSGFDKSMGNAEGQSTHINSYTESNKASTSFTGSEIKGSLQPIGNSLLYMGKKSLPDFENILSFFLLGFSFGF